MPMTCSEVRESLEGFVLGGLPPTQQARLEAHIAACPGCRAAEEECRLLVREIELGAEKAPPRRDFESALRRAVAAGIAAQRRRSRARRA